MVEARQSADIANSRRENTQEEYRADVESLRAVAIDVPKDYAEGVAHRPPPSLR